MACVWVEFTSGGVIVGDTRAHAAYRQTAEEIRQFARGSRFAEISAELFELADRFDRMATAVERRERRRTNSFSHGCGDVSETISPQMGLKER
jgi:hypothetical protein